MKAAHDSFQDRLLSQVEKYDVFLYMMLVFEILLLLFAILSFLFAELDPATRSILMVDFLLLSILLPITGGLIYVCRR